MRVARLVLVPILASALAGAAAHAFEDPATDDLDELYGVDDPAGLPSPGGLADFYGEDDAERDSLLGLHESDSADRMRDMADEADLEAEDSGEPRDPLADPDPLVGEFDDPSLGDESDAPLAGTPALDPLASPLGDEADFETPADELDAGVYGTPDLGAGGFGADGLDD